MSGYSGSGPSGPVSVPKPQGATSGPVFMPRPVQGYQAPVRTVDYSYKPQYQAPRQTQSPQWAVPKAPPLQIGMPGYNYQVGDIDTNPQGIIYNEDGQQIGGPRFNTDGMYLGTWESGLTSGS